MPNRLKLLRDWVAAGGGLMMIGGYFSFQGINGAARWHKTPVEQVLPVTCLPVDDRVEVPERLRGRAGRARASGARRAWAANGRCCSASTRSSSRPRVELLAKLPDEEGGHPLLVAGTHGKGRTLAWTSDIGPHWVPDAFVAWDGYARLWRQSLDWLTAAR